ncbi:GAP family protein [Agrococcus carbonis]|uniref:Sap, sulfolipid-1-addressing protein n=1 Tax=Agrococcus carbonis TaxID=684552 RepID=A0A1H1PHY9_9MICO|nr:GAP family protein [Agrococcus carbonis]SDS10754.1 Sap, sulfolipid-1-addressing protein [Agrococcus carbonis]
MEPALALSLGALALIDSLSIGTLLIPLFFLLTPGRLRVVRVLVYLATIAAFHLAVGFVLSFGAGWFTSALEAMSESQPLLWVQLVLGAALLGGALLLGRPAPKPGSPEAAAILERPPGRLAGWRDAAMDGRGTGALVGVALGAGALELATMLPYLAAIGLVSQEDLPVPLLLAVLAAYCAVMIAPALLLLAGRVLLRRLVEPPLSRLTQWLQLNSAENTAWIVGIVGFLLARDAASRLALFEQSGLAGLLP